MKKDIRKKQPVVVLVGHIDHGKSSILERIRDFQILDKESGGITQHTSTYEIEEDGKRLTFIDTPGHAAFVEMRARGAQIADLAVLVVAADEGVEPQTKEAIKHLKEGERPFVVALNKVDKPNAEPERVKDQLVKEDVVVEDRGGEVLTVETSAETGRGIKELVDVIFLLADMYEFKADFSGPAEGVVVESYLSSKRGSIATLLVNKGTLKEGDVLATTSAFGRIKKMEDFQGKKKEKVNPGQPVTVLGFNENPQVGERFNVCSTLSKAREQSEEKELPEAEADETNETKKAKKTMNVLIKVDVAGSLDPILRVLNELPQEKVGLDVIRAEVGDVGLGDVQMANTCDAVIIGFRVNVPDDIRREAEKARVSVYNFDVIYDLRKGISKVMQAFLGPQKVRVNLAKLETLAVFKTTPRRQVVGVRVERGEIRKGNRIEVFRPENGEVELKPGKGIGEGRIVNLQRNKKDIKSGKEGEEVGILYEGQGEKIKEGDILVAYEIRQKRVELS